MTFYMVYKQLLGLTCESVMTYLDNRQEQWGGTIARWQSVLIRVITKYGQASPLTTPIVTRCSTLRNIIADRDEEIVNFWQKYYEKTCNYYYYKQHLESSSSAPQVTYKNVACAKNSENHFFPFLMFFFTLLLAGFLTFRTSGCCLIPSSRSTSEPPLEFLGTCIKNQTRYINDKMWPSVFWQSLLSLAPSFSWRLKTPGWP